MNKTTKKFEVFKEEITKITSIIDSKEELKIRVKTEKKLDNIYNDLIVTSKDSGSNIGISKIHGGLDFWLINIILNSYIEF